MPGWSSVLALLLTAGSIALASAEPKAPPNAGAPETPAEPDPATAKAILDARQKAVDDIRAGRPAPYYMLPPGKGGGTTPPAQSNGDKKK